jgi:hypothetical protein
MEERMGKIKTVLYSIWLASAVCSFTLLPSLAQSQGGAATLTVGDGSGAPGSQGNQITVSLTNDVSVGGMQLEICDEDDVMVCAGCQVQGRASGFLCDTNEQSEGCCAIILVDVTGGGFAEGAGPIFSLDYTVAENAPAGECKGLDAQEVKIGDNNQQPLDVTSEPGEFCFSSSTTTTSTPCPSREIYGENSQETQLLRSIRDNLLSQTPEGRKIITLYYQWSPAIVKAMKEDKAFEADIRQMIDGFLMLMP